MYKLQQWALHFFHFLTISLSHFLTLLFSTLLLLNSGWLAFLTARFPREILPYSVLDRTSFSLHIAYGCFCASESTHNIQKHIQTHIDPYGNYAAFVFQIWFSLWWYYGGFTGWPNTCGEYVCTTAEHWRFAAVTPESAPAVVTIAKG